MMIKFPSISMEQKAFILFIVNSFIQGVYPERNFNVTNNCSFIVWPVISEIGSSASVSGIALQTGESTEFMIPSPWNGRVWGRTGCSESSDGKFTCETGGCTNSTPNCVGREATTVFTLVEISLSGDGNLELYNVSLVEGYNLPILVTPRSPISCSVTGCVADLDRICPPELQVLSFDGDIIACRNPCRTNKYCCNGSSPCDPTNSWQIFSETCRKLFTYPLDGDIIACRNPCRTNKYCCNGSSPCDPTNSWQIFSETCRKLFTYPLDGDKTDSSTFSCLSDANYSITFCPSVTRIIQETPSSRQGNHHSNKGMKRHTRIILVVVSAMVLLILGIAMFVWWKLKQGERERKLDELHMLDGFNNLDLRLFSYESILTATNNFSADCKLGQGGFGSVYKGRMPDGQDVAVKLLSCQSGQGLLEFKTELILISKLQHVNLVKLLGLCIHTVDKMIIYDYMPNKSLDFFLFSSTQRIHLNWERRFNIIEGIAQGLLYLHKYSRLKIIHRDLKPSNILLDENMNAKISDFGLARVFEQNIDEANTNRRVGTFGYMAPEYAMQGIFSVKSDVYSFGVLVLETVSGRRNNCFHQIEGPLNLVEYAWELWKNNSTLLDPTLRDSCIMHQLKRCIHIALLCVENRAVDRPSIEDVILMLKGEAKNMPMPKNPSFVARNHVHANTKASTLSINGVTLSQIGGR